MKNKDTTISVVIPVYNDPDGLEITVQSLIKQDFPDNFFEIIIADNGSTDSTVEITSKFEKKYPRLIKTVTEDKIQSSYAARNKGISISQGEIISFVDANMITERKWLSEVNKLMKEKDIDYLGCRVDIFLRRKNIFALYNKITGFPVKSYMEKAHFAPTCCLSVRKKVFNEMGLFDERLISGGDLEFGKRVYDCGYYKMYYASDISIKHPARNTLKGLLSKQFRTGRGRRQIALYYKDRFSYGDYSINTFLPVKPSSFLKKLNGSKESGNISIVEKIIFFFIAWFLKISAGTGYVYQGFKKNEKES